MNKEINELLLEIKRAQEVQECAEAQLQEATDMKKEAMMYEYECKHRLRELMSEHEMTKYRSPGFCEAQIVRGRTSVKIIDEDKVPQEYLSEKTYVSIDKKKVKDSIELMGKDVPGVELTCNPIMKINFV